MTPLSRMCRYLVAMVCAAACGAAADHGTLTVRTDPPSVEVWLDNSFIGESPVLEMTVEAGPHRLRLVDPHQHASLTEDIFVTAGRKTVVEKTITAKYGSLEVRTKPPGARVRIATVFGDTPFENSFVIPGRYRLEIKAPGPGYQVLHTDVVIARGEKVVIDTTLPRLPLLTRKAKLRLALGAASIAAFSYAIAEHESYKLRGDEAAGVRRTLSIVGGVLCVVGFEVVAFF